MVLGPYVSFVRPLTPSISRDGGDLNENCHKYSLRDYYNYYYYDYYIGVLASLYLVSDIALIWHRLKSS